MASDKYAKIKNVLKYHIVDSTALLTFSNPIFSVMETIVSGMSDAESIKSRESIAGLTYLGLGYLYGKGRDLSRKIFKINDQTKEKIQYVHDAVYSAAFNAALSPLIYHFLAGVDDPRKIALGTMSTIGYSLLLGAPMGYSVDVLRDLTGLKKCERKSYQQIIQNKSSKTKKFIAAGLIAASIAAMAAVYSLTPDKTHIQQSQTLEERIK